MSAMKTIELQEAAMMRAALYPHFEALGIDEVRRRAGAGNFYEDALTHAKVWLQMKDQEADASRSAANIELKREANALARDANDLAATATAAAEDAASSSRRSAVAAERANKIATIAVIAAIITAAISMVTIFASG